PISCMLSPYIGNQIDKPSQISKLEQEDKVMTEERGITPDTCPDLEVLLKAKGLTSKQHVFRKEQSKGITIVRVLIFHS
ncbi:hypothetical protein DBR06_SOUSAS8010154, partial [Sousa chinensis]